MKVSIACCCTPGITMKSGWPFVPYVNQAPNMLLPCCAIVRPHPDSAGFHHRSVRSMPHLGAASPKGSRWICFVREVEPMVQVNVAGPPGVKWKVALPTRVWATAAGLKGPL